MSLRIRGRGPGLHRPGRPRAKSTFISGSADGYAVLFSHPKDFTPVCTTELGYMAGLKKEFDTRNTKDHRPEHRFGRGSQALVEGYRGDAGARRELSDESATWISRFAKAYDMIHPNATGEAKGRTAQDNATIRSVFVIGPDRKIKGDIHLSDVDRPKLRRGAARAGLRPADREAQGRHTGELEAGTGRDHPPGGERRIGEQKFPGGWKAASRTCAWCSSRSKARLELGRRPDRRTPPYNGERAVATSDVVARCDRGSERLLGQLRSQEVGSAARDSTRSPAAGHRTVTILPMVKNALRRSVRDPCFPRKLVAVVPDCKHRTAPTSAFRPG